MKNIVGAILVLAFLLSVMFFPTSTKQIFESIRNISASAEYEMKRIKVDSIVADNASFQDGTETSTYYTVISAGLDRTLVITDHDKSMLVSKDGEEANIPHLFEYMRAHHDTIWVWYHPKAELKYARLESPFVSNREEWLYFFLSMNDCIVAIVGAIIVTRYFIKQRRKKQKANP